MANFKGISLLLLRLAIAAIFLVHGLPKFIGFPSGVMGAFEGMGFPGFLGPIVAVVEVASAILLLLGLWTRWPSYALIVVMLVAIFGVHLSEGFSANIERNMLVIAGLLVISAFGPGTWAISRKQE